MSYETANADEPAAEAGAVIVYDGDCPVCSAYVRVLRLRESVGPVTLHNAREGGELIDRIVDAGINLDEGMALIYGGQIYHGVECINRLALLSSPSGLLNRMNAFIFRSPRLSRALYPILRAGRNLLLRLLGRSPLDL